GVRAIDIGITTYGEKKGLDQEVYEKLRMENEVLEKIAPLVIKERYLREKDYVKMSQIYDSMMKTPGERRTVGRSVLEEGVRHGVKLGTFGLGELVDGTPSCRFFKEDASVSFSDNEVLVSDTLCISQRQAPGVETTVIPVGPFEAGTGQAQWTKPPEISEKVMNELTIRFGVPRGKVSQIMGI